MATHEAPFRLWTLVVIGSRFLENQSVEKTKIYPVIDSIRSVYHLIRLSQPEADLSTHHMLHHRHQQTLLYLPHALIALPSSSDHYLHLHRRQWLPGLHSTHQVGGDGLDACPLGCGG